MKKIFVSLLLMLAPAAIVYSQQSPIDSLTNLLKTYVDTPRVIVLNKLSFQHMLRGQYKTALGFGNQALELSKEIDYKRGHAKSLVNIGNVYLAQSDLQVAAGHFLNAYTLAKEIKDLIIISHCTNNLGEVYRNQGNYEKAIYYYLESLKIAEALADKAEQSGTLNNIALVYSEMNNRQKAIEYYRKGLSIATELQNKYEMSTMMLNMGTLFHDIGNKDSANLYYQKALKIKEEIQDPEGVATILLGLGNLAEDDDQALNYYTRAFRLSETLQDPAKMSACLNSIGTIYFRRGDNEKAIESEKVALKYASQAGSKKDIQNAYYNLATMHEKIGEYKKSIVYFRQYTLMHDSIFTSESTRQIAEMQVRYESEKKEKEVELLKKEQTLLMLTNRNQKIIFAAIAGLIAMAGAVFYFRAQTNKQKNITLREKIDSQNRELTTISLLVSKKNQALGQLKNDLDDIAKTSSSPKAIDDMAKNIAREIDFDEEWSMFKYHFEKVHPDFFNKLKSLAPSLSVNELRLCGYLRANFTTKEIASLTNTTVRAVQQAKYRINQKFPNSNGNLPDYLMTL
jgi:tetratricopeptide (TPR) repeat protein